MAEDPPVRKSRGTEGILPADGWWFQDYVPKWARLLPRATYEAVFASQSAIWEIKHALKGIRRGRGRPRLTVEEEDGKFLLQVEVEKLLMHQEGCRVTETGALRRLTGKKDVETERARVNRIRKDFKVKGILKA